MRAGPVPSSRISQTLPLSVKTMLPARLSGVATVAARARADARNAAARTSWPHAPMAPTATTRPGCTPPACAGSTQNRLCGSPAAAQMRSCSRSDSSNSTGRSCPNGGTPPIAYPVAARTSSAAAIRTSATSSASATLSRSIRWRPLATQSTGSPSATNTIALAISASSQPTASAASLTVRVDALSRSTRTSRPSSRARSASLSLTPRRAPGRALARPARPRPRRPARPATPRGRRRTRPGPRAGRSRRPARS